MEITVPDGVDATRELTFNVHVRWSGFSSDGTWVMDVKHMSMSMSSVSHTPLVCIYFLVCFVTFFSSFALQKGTRDETITTPTDNTLTSQPSSS